MLTHSVHFPGAQPVPAVCLELTQIVEIGGVRQPEELAIEVEQRGLDRGGRMDADPQIEGLVASASSIADLMFSPPRTPPSPARPSPGPP